MYEGNLIQLDSSWGEAENVFKETVESLVAFILAEQWHVFLIIESAERQTDIVSAKAESIAECEVNVALNGFVESEV